MQIIAHIDMDCFFCSCEEKHQPKIKGKPVIVGSTGHRGVVSAANYEARKFGVYSATPIGKARELCPDGVFLGVDKDLYHEESRKIMDILTEIADDMEQVSVDEAYLDLTEFSENFDTLKDMAKNIKEEIMQKTGLSCSIGVSCSRTISKIASDFRKPGGITIVKDAKEFLKDMPIGKIPGIGKKSKQYYIDNRVEKIGDLVKLDNFTIMDKFGRQAIDFKKIALGEDRTGLYHRDISKSVSRENTFIKDIAKATDLERELAILCSRVYEDLGNMYFKTISIKLRNSGFATITRDRTFKTSTRSLKAIILAALELFRKSYESEDKIRLLGVKLSNLSCDKEIQTTLDMF